MKQRTIYLFLIILSISLLSCSDDPINKITFQNLAEGDVHISFRGSQIDVVSGSTVELESIDKGEYQYATVFDLPPGTTNFSTDGDLSGTFKLKAGTKILVIYTSVFSEGQYTISATVTTSDDQTVDENPNPIFP